MNANTKEDLKSLIDAVVELAEIVAALDNQIALKHAMKEVQRAGRQLRDQLDSDETILQ